MIKVRVAQKVFNMSQWVRLGFHKRCWICLNSNPRQNRILGLGLHNLCFKCLKGSDKGCSKGVPYVSKVSPGKIQVRYWGLGYITCVLNVSKGKVRVAQKLFNMSQKYLQTKYKLDIGVRVT